MLKDLKVEASVKIDADAQTVWKALTAPEHIAKYLYGTNTETDWKTGNSIVFSGEYNGVAYRDHGRLLDVTPFASIVYTYWSNFSGIPDEPENYSVISYRLEEADGGTLFTWTQQGFATDAGYEHSRTGMAALLENIRQVAESLKEA